MLATISALGRRTTTRAGRHSLSCRQNGAAAVSALPEPGIDSSLSAACKFGCVVKASKWQRQFPKVRNRDSHAVRSGPR